jgi:glycosyltransferase involved in cell wall biosynthesis
MYSKYNNIVCVSKYTLNNFISIYPQLKERSTFVYNLLDIETIREKSLKACKDITFDYNITNIVSIGRINPVKQFHLIPQIISKILNDGVSNFRWILIGGVDSGALEQINKEVEKYGITEEHFKYIGPQFNPYPYIKNSDILVSTSSSEACPFVVNEARVLGVPVVSNNYPSIYEFIEDDVNGKICTIDKMATILSNLIKNENSLAVLKQRMKEVQYNNAKIITQINNILASN